MTIQPAASLSKWFAIGFTIVVFCYSLWRTDAIDVLFLSVVFLPWVVGPCLVAALLCRRASSAWAAWSYLAVEIAVIGSTIVLYARMYANPDAQDGIAMLIFPAFQFGGVFVAYVVATALAVEVRQ